ncbi:prenyltransferase/squalene oxidase repeat-containing protein [Alienimonas sp. DA493]|uniref:prenyltransferase/squalene oxidase repeat-containing protein n=1 Tax=Alienimonas sp. DA493 TaxID=3373605 RepID=UPI0037545761
MTALCGLAWASGGSVPTGGPHADNAAAAARFLLDSQQPDGLFFAADSPDTPPDGSMYGHGFATLYLCEILGELTEPRFDPDAARAALVRAVRRITDSQNAAGGWRYVPTSADADISVTVCQIAALRSARDAGLDVPDGVVPAAIAYVRSCRNPADGGFFYQADRREGSRFARSAAAVSALRTAGLDDPAVEAEIAAGLRYLLAQRPGRGGGAYPHYGRFYATRAAWQAGGETWAAWFPPMRDELVRTAIPDAPGVFWRDGLINDEYATAMSVLALRVPARLLPIYRR